MSNKKFRIFCDMDGVLVDLHTGVQKVFGKIKKIDINNVDYLSVYNITYNEFHDGINKDKKFWQNLKPYEWAYDLIDLLEDYGEVCILSSPAKNALSAYGKIEWIENNFPNYSDKLLLGSCKYFCANENSILVDDMQKYCDSFKEGGGNIILFPQNYNKNKDFVNNELRYIKYCLEEIINEK